MSKKPTISDMEKRLKEMRKAYRLIKILHAIALTGALAGLFGIFGTAGALEWNNITFGRFIIQAVICCIVMFTAGLFLDKTETIPELLKKNIFKLTRMIRQEKYRLRQQLECDAQSIIPHQNRIVS